MSLRLEMWRRVKEDLISTQMLSLLKFLEQGYQAERDKQQKQLLLLKLRYLEVPIMCDNIFKLILQFT